MRTGLRPRQRFTVRRTVSPHIIRMFGELTGDVNSRHMSGETDRPPLAHGLYLLATLIPMFTDGLDMVGHRLDIDVRGPAYAGDEVTATITVRSVRPAGAFGDTATLTFDLRNQREKVLATGSLDILATPRPDIAGSRTEHRPPRAAAARGTPEPTPSAAPEEVP